MTFEIGPCYGGVLHEKLLLRLIPSKVEDSSTGPAYYIDDNNDLVTIPLETSIYKDGRFWSVPSFSNYLANPLSPASQTTGTLGVGNYTVWVRGSGSVAVSENTATITGAGSAVEGNPLHFSVTVAGTVDVVVTGDCTVFQLTDTIFSTEPFLVDGLFTLVNHAGTTYASMEVGDKLYSLLDGKTGNLEKFQSPYSTTWTILNGLYSVTAGAVTKYLYSDFTVIAGRNYEISYFVVANSLSNDAGLSGSSAFVITYLIFDITPGWHTIRIIASDTQTIKAFVLGINIGSGNIVLSNISVKEVSKPSFKLEVKLKTKFNYSDFPVSYIESILYSGTIDFLTLSTDASGNGYINLSDGTNTVSVDYNWAYEEEITIEVPLGYNAAEAADKMQLIVNGTASALTDFDGSLNPDTEMIMGRNNDYLFGVAVKILHLKQSDFQ